MQCYVIKGKVPTLFRKPLLSLHSLGQAEFLRECLECIVNVPEIRKFPFCQIYCHSSLFRMFSEP